VFRLREQRELRVLLREQVLQQERELQRVQVQLREQRELLQRVHLLRS
jgi:hypothetical protein